MRDVIALFRLDTDDRELARAQFRAFSKQVPLLYLILICNSLAVMVDYFRPDQLLKTFVVPSSICAIAAVRAVWWWRQEGADTFSDTDIIRYIKRTATLAVILTVVFELWCMWIYPQGDAYARGHVTLFLALTEVSTVFCLMVLRAAAMRVAAISTVSFVVYFTWIDHGRMPVESIVLCFVAAGMMVVTHRYNLDFSQLIRSRRDLRDRQVETEKLSEENRRIALTDALSGLPNRRALLAHLDRLEEESLGRAGSLAIVFIDLDGFKDVNDAHGHHAGDALISTLSARLGTICPPHAMLARVGGDEFAVLIEGEGASAQAFVLAQRISQEICLPVLIDGNAMRVGASIGIAGNEDGAIHAHELLRRADTAMYHVKVRGKGEIAVYDAEFDRGRLRRLAIEEEIVTGLAEKEFEVFYQPVVDAGSGAVVSAEALIRWPRRANGPLDPEQFIEIAEATGQIHPLGLFVLERACRDFAELGNLNLNVNVSPAQFRDPGFERQVVQVLERTRFPPERLQFEITERYLLADPEQAIRAIEAFKAMGISIALDDFGTGFTSIHYLQSYGFSHIKIDKSLLTGLRVGSKASLLITGAIYLACGLDMRVVAEGVETAEQAALLRAAGCHELQGYLFGRPTPLADFMAANGADIVRREIPPPRLEAASRRHASK